MNQDNSLVRTDQLSADEIPVKIGRQTKYISGVKDFTTCSDILIGVLKSEKILDVSEGNVSQHYALLESWRGVTKVLSGSSPVLRIWQAWAAEQQHVSFVVKRIRHPRSNNSSRGLDENVGQNWIEKMRAQVRLRDDPDQSQDALSKQESSNAKLKIGHVEMVRQKTNANKERRLSRRSSSLSRARRPPDTFHPSAVNREVRDMVRLNKPTVTAEVKHEEKNQDTSEDSGIVTDDSEVRAVSLNSKYYDVRRQSFPKHETKIYYEELWSSRTLGPSKLSTEPQTLLKPPPDHSSFYEMAQDIENLQRINVLLEENQEQILALEFEYKMLMEEQRIPVKHEILDDFRAEVNKFKDMNSEMLQRILSNRSSMEIVSQSHVNRKQVLKQLEFDINVVEREGKRLESSLQELNNIGKLHLLDKLTNSGDLPQPKLPDRVTNKPDRPDLLPSTLV